MLLGGTADAQKLSQAVGKFINGGKSISVTATAKDAAGLSMADFAAAQTNPTAQVTIEQQVSNKVTITYVTNLSQASQQAIFVEYYINRDLSIIAGRDQYGVVSFDIKQRRRKR